MKNESLITVLQAKALGSCMIEAIPTDLTATEATYLIDHTSLVNEAVIDALRSLVGGSQTTKATEERLDIIVKKMGKVLPEVLSMDNPGLTTTHHQIGVSRLTDLLAFVSKFVSGRETVSFPDLEMDLTIFGYNLFGDLDEVEPTSFSELKLISCKDYLADRESNKACGQITAEWIARNHNKIPRDWRPTEAGKILSFPGTEWRHKHQTSRMACVTTQVHTSFRRIWMDHGCPQPRSDSSVVCRF